MSDVKVIYICDGRACDGDCSECFRTSNIEHARDFERIGSVYFQKPAPETEPLIIRSKVFFSAEDFAKWSEQIKAKCPNAMILPNTAEVVPPGAIRGEWIFNTDENGKSWNVCSICGHDQFHESNYCPNCGTHMRRAKTNEKP